MPARRKRRHEEEAARSTPHWLPDEQSEVRGAQRNTLQTGRQWLAAAMNRLREGPGPRLSLTNFLQMGLNTQMPPSSKDAETQLTAAINFKGFFLMPRKGGIYLG